MHPVQLEHSPLLALSYSIAIYGVMLFWAQCLVGFNVVGKALTIGSARYGSIDGLRGLLAVGVLIHHSITSYIYMTTGQWIYGESSILNQLGESTVALFFMITGFLFTLKAMSKEINYKDLYVSRLARLGPLYWIIVVILFAVVMSLNGGVLRESSKTLLLELMKWLGFVVFGRPDVNAQYMSWTLIAGVNWSLKYEVLFYLFAVPALHVAARIFVPIKLLLATISLICILFFLRFHYSFSGGISLYVAQFLGGISIAYVYKIPILYKLTKTMVFKIIAMICVMALLSMTHSTNNIAIICTTVVFAAVVGGSSLFGLLNTRAAIWLGDISYGIYLIHGLILWVTLTVIGKFMMLSSIDMSSFWFAIILVSFVVTLLASLSYMLMERPIMQCVARAKSAKINPATVMTN